MQKTRPLLFPLLLVVAGIATFKFAFEFILNGKDEKKQFHEIRWEPREVINTVIDSALIDTVPIHLLAEERQHFALIPAGKKSIDSLLVKQRTALIHAREYVAAMSNSAVEAYADKSIRLASSFNLRDLVKIDSNHSSYRQPVAVIYADSSLITKSVTCTVLLPLKDMDSDRFFLKYPNFGFWALSLLIQTVLYVLLILFLLYKTFSHTENFPLKWKIPYAILITVVCIAFYRWLLKYNDDTAIVKPELFMSNMNSIFKVINPLGYITVALCFAGMLFCSGAAARILKNNAIAAHKDELLEINNNFKIYFLIAALTMTFAVIATGQFYTALNSLDLVKAYNATIGHDYFRMEIVYLYGILHTFVLMAFYLPAQLQLNASNQAMLAALPPEEAKVKVFEPVPMIKKVMDLLVMGAPLLAAFVKSLIDVLAG
ncbi:hypothetical protein [Chitinophaga vietnamensis]|uniref:hypothetical protein n=1 Tax=Chitinophaga vietnamensis TaxID=2593957 RepID=UPI001177EC57|nr:hypothetical protein [Chitinophaga vietnamensis]